MKVVRIILVILLAMVFGVAVMLPLFLLYAGVKIITGVASKI